MSTLQGRRLLIGLIGMLCLIIATLSFLIMNPRAAGSIMHKPAAAPANSSDLTGQADLIARIQSNMLNRQYELVLSDLQQAMRSGGDTEELYFLRGVAWAGKGEHLKAIADYDTVLRKNPTFRLATLNKGRSYERLNEPAKAIAAYKEFIRSAPADDPQMENAQKMLAAVEQKMATGPGEWKLVGKTNSPQALVNTPVNKASLTFASADGSIQDIVYLDLIESGWVIGVANSNYYEFLRDNETVQRARRKYTLAFVAKEKELTVEQFTRIFIEPSQKRGDVKINIINQSEKEAYVELTGNAGYTLTRIIKGKLSMIVVTFFARNPSEAQKVFGRQVLQNATKRPADFSPQEQGSIPPLS